MKGMLARFDIQGISRSNTPLRKGYWRAGLMAEVCGHTMQQLGQHSAVSKSMLGYYVIIYQKLWFTLVKVLPNVQNRRVSKSDWNKCFAVRISFASKATHSTTYFMSEVKVWRQLIILFRCFVFCNLLWRLLLMNSAKPINLFPAQRCCWFLKAQHMFSLAAFLLICQIPRHELYAFVNKLDRF